MSADVSDFKVAYMPSVEMRKIMDDNFNYYVSLFLPKRDFTKYMTELDAKSADFNQKYEHL